MNATAGQTGSSRLRAVVFLGLAAMLLAIVAGYGLLGPPSRRAPAVDVAYTTQAIRINYADAAELQLLPQIGPALAQRIIEERNRRPFDAPQDLRRVRGIGPKIIDQVTAHVRFD